MTNPYQVLGVPSTSSDNDIRKAYRMLAKKYHPDLNPGNKAAEQKFKEITAAYDLLGDPAKKARFDRGEIDDQGQEVKQSFGGGYGPWDRPHPRQGQGRRSHFTGGGRGPDLSSLFEGLFTEGAPAETRAEMTLDFLDAVNGSSQHIRLGGRSLNITIPPGTKEGSVLRLRQQGEGGGDLLLTLHIRPHPWFKMDGDNILLDLPVTLPEGVLGAKIRVPTLTGFVDVTVPKGSTTGRVLRLKGKGVKGRGDQLITLHVMLPPTVDAELEKFLHAWSENHPYNPRSF